MSINVFNSDCLEWLRKQPDNSIDSIVTDPPYGLSKTTAKHVEESLKAWIGGDTEYTPPIKGGFMGKDWDSFVPPPAVWIECLRVLKPGGHMAVFAGSRTQDLMGMSIRLAGFEIRDTLGWVYSQGFPKSQNISLQIEKQAGKRGHTAKAFVTAGDYGGRGLTSPDTKVQHSPLTMEEAQQWEGWGTALKPAIEPIILARKPLDGTVANNVLEHGTGGLNIDACRVGNEVRVNPPGSTNPRVAMGDGWNPDAEPTTATGRFPANVLLDEVAAAEMDKQSGVSVSRANTKSDERGAEDSHIFASSSIGRRDPSNSHNDSGGASRFFPVFKYQAKAPKKERPVIEREDGTKIQHPTVKPVALMEWLVSLITPPNGVVLDPFAGTGTTLQAAHNKGFDVIGVEAEEEYVNLIFKRLTGNEE